MQRCEEQFHEGYVSLDRCFTDVIFMGSFDVHGFAPIGQGKPPTANVYTFLTVNDMHV